MLVVTHKALVKMLRREPVVERAIQGFDLVFAVNPPPAIQTPRPDADPAVRPPQKLRT